jgi:hypothetical protein
MRSRRSYDPPRHSTEEVREVRLAGEHNSESQAQTLPPLSDEHLMFDSIGPAPEAEVPSVTESAPASDRTASFVGVDSAASTPDTHTRRRVKQ